VNAPRFVTSQDGTRIAYRLIGGGPPVVALHGALGSWRSWLAVAERLADRFTFALVDRRGRGDSEAGASPHALEREVEDARAVLEAVGPGATVVGHSFGGAVALELARTAEPGQVDRLVLYEPGVRVAGLVAGPVIERLEALAARGQGEQVLELALAELDAAGLVRADGAAWGPSPERRALAEIAWTLPREIRAVDALGEDLDRYTAIEAPTLLLVGAQSPECQQRNCNALTRALTDIELVELDGQGHVAHNSNPDRVAGIIGAFLDGSSGQPSQAASSSSASGLT
jgi:pimeloyl-ACP methyl ester carboxylesterase